MGFVGGAFDCFISLIFPRRCEICDRGLSPSRSLPLCVEHAREIIPTEAPVCGKCGRKMFGESVESLVCARCRSMRVSYDAGYSACLYEGTLRELVHRFKYTKRRYLGWFLGELIVNYVREHADGFRYEGIIPVPLHWRRYWSRGFNQAADLARPLSRRYRLPVLRRSLRRVRYTRPQVSLGPEERRTNIRGAFRVRRPARVAGKKLLLIDDVITTGATLNECARVLKGAGATEVTIVTVAHPSGFRAHRL